MHDASAFLRTIAAAPDDDAPRLVYADWLEDRGDPRGAFIRVQCALAALPPDDPRRPDLEDAERRLRAAHAANWTAELNGAVRAAEFRRGFVEGVALSAAAFLEHGEKLLAPGLVRTVRLADCGDAVPALARCPLLARVESLDLGVNYLGDEKMAALLRSEHVRGVRGLGLSYNSLTNAGLRAVLDAGPWPRLTALDLQGNAHVTGRGAIDLARSRAVPALEAVDLRDNQVDSAGAWSLANSKAMPRLSDLALAGNPLGDAGGRAVALSPLLARQLARTGVLDLRATGLGPAGVQALVAGDRLRPAVVLNLNRNDVGDAGVTALSVANLPRLRELHLAGNGVTDEGAAALAGAPFLGRLRALDLADNRLGPGGRVALMSSPYWHWRTDIDVTDNHPPPSLDDVLAAEDGPLALDYEDE
jgi:uncharacterized protein (TIGR02996 family)